MSSVSATTLDGFYYGNDATALASAQSWLGKTVGIVSEHTGRASWSDWLSSINYVINASATVTATKRWSIPLFSNDGNLQSAAAGDYNSYYVQAAKKLVAAYGTTGPIIVRTGEEFNGTWMPWAAASDPASYIKAYQNFVDAFRSVSGNFKFEWNVNVGGSMDPSTAYPGDNYVDYISMDFYWDSTKSWSIQDPVQAFNYFKNTPYGLQWLENFASAHGKPSAYGEWGVNSPNASAYLTLVKQWFDAHNPAFEIYWDSNSGGFNGQIDNGAYGAASDTFKALFGAVTAATAAAGPATSATPAVTDQTATTGTSTPATTTSGSASTSTPTTSDSNAVVTTTPANTSTSTSTTTPVSSSTTTTTSGSTSSSTTTTTTPTINFATTTWSTALLGLTDTQFVNWLYMNMLNRAPDSAGLAGWLSLLSKGTSRADMLRGFIASPEHRGLETAGTAPLIAMSSDGHLLDGSTGAGIITVAGKSSDFVIDANTTKGSLITISTGTVNTLANVNTILFDDKIVTIAGDGSTTGLDNSWSVARSQLSNAQYVQWLYDSTLNRPADSAGLAGWLSLLSNGASRADLLRGFINSPEHHSLETAGTAPLIAMSSDGHLLDGSTGAGIITVAGKSSDFIIDANTNKGSLITAATGTVNTLANVNTILFDDKIVTIASDGSTTSLDNSWSVAKNQLSNAQYVQWLYDSTLNRPADSAGLTGWLSLLSAGTSRTDLLRGFINSPEHHSLETAGTAPLIAMSSDGHLLDGSTGAGIITVAGKSGDFIVDANTSKGSLITAATGTVNTLANVNTILFDDKIVTIAGDGSTNSLDNSWSVAKNQLSNAQYVQWLYDSTLNRPADSAGLTAWLSLLSAGTSRADLLRGFINSPEHHGIQTSSSAPLIAMSSDGHQYDATSTAGAVSISGSINNYVIEQAHGTEAVISLTSGTVDWYTHATTFTFSDGSYHI